MSLVQGPQGAEQLISPILFMQALNRRPQVNNDELERKLKEYIDSKFATLKTPDLEEIKSSIKTDIQRTLPNYLRTAGFQTKDELEAYIRGLNLVLREEFERRMAGVGRKFSELVIKDKENSDAILVLKDRIKILEDKIPTLGSSEAVDQAILSIEQIRTQIGNTNINELNIPGLTAKVDTLENQINLVVPLFNDEARRLSLLYTDLEKLYQGLKAEQDIRDTAYDLIDGRMTVILNRLIKLEQIKFVKPEEFESHKTEIETQIIELKDSIKLINIMKQDINGIRAALTELKSITIPEIATKLENRLTLLETKMTQVDMTKLSQVNNEVTQIREQFNAELVKLRAEINSRIDFELDKLSKGPSGEEFNSLKELAKEFKSLSKGSLTQLKDTLAGIAGINARIERIEKTGPIQQAQLEGEIKNLKIYLVENLKIINDELQRSKQTSINKYLKGGSPNDGKYMDLIEDHIKKANAQIELVTKNIDLLMKAILKPAQEHIEELEKERSSYNSNPTEQNKVEKLLLETVAVRNRFAHEVEYGLYVNDLLGIKHYAEENIAKIKNPTENFPKDSQGKPIYPDIPAIKVPILSKYKLDERESIKDEKILTSRNKQIEELSTAIQQEREELRPFILGVKVDGKEKLFNVLDNKFKLIYEKYTLERRTNTSDTSDKSDFILTETPTY